MKRTFGISLLISILVLSGCSSLVEETGSTVGGVQPLIIDGEPYFIRGVCYHPVPKGSRVRSFDRLEEDLAMMQAAGINTIRVYEPIDDRAVLDSIAAAGIKVIISIGYNQGGKYDILSGSFTDYINAWKDHEAILLWELGNEYNYHPDWFGGDIQNWYNALDAAAVLAKQLDPSRPVATAHGELPDAQALASYPNIDVWGMNVYRWDNPEGIFEDWPKLSDKPMYLPDAEGYTPGPNEKAQADAMRAILDDISRFPDVCSGVAIFAFVDEWWKDEEGSLDTQDVGGKPPPAGFPYDAVANEEYWGILTIDREPKEAYGVVREFFLADQQQ